jgi:predicted Zn-dependent protease
MQGESGLGQQVAQQVMEQLPMVTDPEIRAYVNDIGCGSFEVMKYPFPI